MRWRERRALLSKLDTTPGIAFNSTGCRAFGEPEYTMHYGIYDQPDLGNVEVICPGGKERKAFLEHNSRRVCGATKLYRRIHGVRRRDPEQVLGEATRLPSTAWKAEVRGGTVRFSCYHALYGNLHLRTWDMLGEDALLSWGTGHTPIPAAALYMKLKKGLDELRRTLSGPRLWRREHDGKYTTILAGQVATVISVQIEPQRFEFHLRIGTSVVSTIVSTSEYELWKRAKESYESMRGKKKTPEAPRLIKRRKKHRRIHKGRRKR